MSWQVLFRPEVEQDVIEAVTWYEMRQPGLGTEFLQEIFQVWDELSQNPLLHSRRHPTKNIRWRYPRRFPYRVIYEAVEESQTVVVVAVLHAAKHERTWQKRI